MVVFAGRSQTCEVVFWELLPVMIFLADYFSCLWVWGQMFGNSMKCVKPTSFFFYHELDI